jgi:1-acyl-sn-glycerol-3-phosphate acyltransferase
MNDMPPIKNHFLYSYRIFAKWFCFFIFGLSTLIMSIIIFPVLTLVVRPHAALIRVSRRFVSRFFSFFVKMMCFLGCVKIEVPDKKAFCNLGGKIVIANHPSLLDVVMLIALIPNADCIVNAALMRGVTRGVVRRLYILNSRKFDDIVASCKKTLAEGNCLIIFPEGTRTPRSGEIKFKKGAARISLASNTSIVSVIIGGNDKWGLGKHDPLTAFNHNEKYIYEINIANKTDPQEFLQLENTIAVKRLNEKLEQNFKDVNNHKQS